MNCDERLNEIANKIEELVKVNDGKSLVEVRDMINWKLGVHESVQSDERKLDDVYYFLNGVLFAKDLVKDWCGNKK